MRVIESVELTAGSAFGNKEGSFALAFGTHGSFGKLAFLAQDVLLDEAIKDFETIVVGVGSLDDSLLFLGGAKLGAHELDDEFRGDSEVSCNFLQVEDVGLGTVESRFRLDLHLVHSVSVTRVVNVGRDVQHFALIIRHGLTLI